MAARMTRSTAVVAGLALIVWFAGQCWGQSLTMTEKGLLGGGVLGAGSGAIVGAAVHHPVKGALIGGGIGALAGGVVGHELQTRDEGQYRMQSEVSGQERQIERQRREIEELKQSQATEVVLRGCASPRR
jgi:Glycine zipper